MDHLPPPRLDGCKMMPTRCVKVKPKPTLQVVPNAQREAPLQEKMSGGFLGLIAKVAHSTIGPPSSSKSIRRPNSILYHQPSKELAFWSCPRFPNHGRQRGGDLAHELHLVSRPCRVASIIGELPRNGIRQIVLQMGRVHLLPKVVELCNVL